MSIYLKNNNWLVADWIMKKFNRDIEVIDCNKFEEIRNELTHSEKIYTFLIDYSNASRKKLEALNELVSEILVSYEKKRIVFEGESEAFESYKLKLLEFHSLILEDLEECNHDA